MLVQRWASVEDDWPTLYQHRLNVSCLLKPQVNPCPTRCDRMRCPVFVDPFIDNHDFIRFKSVLLAVQITHSYHAYW